MAQVKTIQENLTEEQVESFRRQLQQMEQLAQEQQRQIRSCRGFLDERNLLTEYEAHYGSLIPADLEQLKNQEEKLTKTETPEQAENREKSIRASKKVLKI